MSQVHQMNTLTNASIMQFGPRDATSIAQPEKQHGSDEETRQNLIPTVPASSHQVAADQQVHALPPLPQVSPDNPTFSLVSSAVSLGPSPSTSASARAANIAGSQLSGAIVTLTTPTKEDTGNGKQPQATAYTISPPHSSLPFSAPLQQQLQKQREQQEQKQQEQQQQAVCLVNIPVKQSYSYQPTTQHTYTSNLLLSGQPITPISSAQTTQSTGRPPRNKSKFKRFRNAFIFFVNDQRTKVDDETKRLKNREFLQLMSARWKSMSEEERKPYMHLAEEDKKRFNEDVKKYGKYESRQRRSNKSRSFDAGVSSYHPYNLANARLSNTTTASAAAANLLYSGYGNLASNQAAAAAAAAAAINGPLQPFYAGFLANTPNTAAAAGMQYPQQALLSPPGTLSHRNSVCSSVSNTDLGELPASFSPSYAWPTTPGTQATVAAGRMQPQAIQQQGYYAAAGYQQAPSSCSQMPAGAPGLQPAAGPMLYECTPSQQQYYSIGKSQQQPAAHTQHRPM